MEGDLRFLLRENILTVRVHDTRLCCWILVLFKFVQITDHFGLCPLPSNSSRIHACAPYVTCPLVSLQSPTFSATLCAHMLGNKVAIRYLCFSSGNFHCSEKTTETNWTFGKLTTNFKRGRNCSRIK